jgi:hypothetical protein
MLGVIFKPQSFLHEFEAGDPSAMFFPQDGLEDTPVMFEDQVDLADLGPFLALEAIVIGVFAAGIAEFLIGSAAECFAAGLAVMEDRFERCHQGIICDDKNKRFLYPQWGNFLADY